MRYLAILGSAISIGISAPIQAASPDFFSEPGVVRAPNGSCEASITQSPPGGIKVLVITRLREGRREQALEAKDVTGAIWMANDKLVYSLGPRQGLSGVFYFDCASGERKRLVTATTPNQAYPQGADYFELDDFSRGAVIWYYHIPDVALMDAPAFRKLDFLRHKEVTEPYAAHIAKAYPGFQLVEQNQFQSWVTRHYVSRRNPGLITGRFNDDDLEDFAAIIHSHDMVRETQGDIEYEFYLMRTVVCHGRPQGGYDECQQLSGDSRVGKGKSRFFLIPYARGSVECLDSVAGRYGDHLEPKTIEIETDGIGEETDVAAGLFVYQPDDRSYWRCTTAD
jgi:hypothetical protein